MAKHRPAIGENLTSAIESYEMAAAAKCQLISGVAFCVAG